MQTKIDWFEIPSNDFQRAVKFYETIFDTALKPESFGPSRMAIFAVKDGESIGCVLHGENYKPGANGIVLYLNAGKDFDQILARVKLAGGSIAMDKFVLPDGMGSIAHFIDTEGNRLGLHME